MSGGGGGSGAGAPGGVTGGYQQISSRQAEQAYRALPDHQKRKQAAPKGAQQFGSAQRYHMAGVAPGWFDPSLNNQKQLEKLQVVEAQKQQERLDKLNPPVIPPTRGQPISVRGGQLFNVGSGAFNVAPLVQAIQQSAAPVQSPNADRIQAIRNAFIQSLL